jgi:quinol monooxygenase YgiN
VIFIVVKFPVHPDRADEFPSLVKDFTAGTRSEAGNVFFEWSRSVDDPNEYVLVEGFRDDAAGAAHVRSDHFREAMELLPGLVTATPKIINITIPGDDWSQMAELQPRRS